MSVALIIVLWYLSGAIPVVAYTIWEFYIKSSKTELTLTDMLESLMVSIFGPISALMVILFFLGDMWEMIKTDHGPSKIVLLRKKD